MKIISCGKSGQRMFISCCINRKVKKVEGCSKCKQIENEEEYKLYKFRQNKEKRRLEKKRKRIQLKRRSSNV